MAPLRQEGIILELAALIRRWNLSEREVALLLREAVELAYAPRSATPANTAVEEAMALADAYVVAASGDTATARHKYSTARAELKRYLEQQMSHRNKILI